MTFISYNLSNQTTLLLRPLMASHLGSLNSQVPLYLNLFENWLENIDGKIKAPDLIKSRITVRGTARDRILISEFCTA